MQKHTHSAHYEGIFELTRALGCGCDSTIRNIGLWFDSDFVGEKSGCHSGHVLKQCDMVIATELLILLRRSVTREVYKAEP